MIERKRVMEIARFQVKDLRLYYNHGKNISDKQWSIDTGSGQCEILARTVIIANCHGVTEINEQDLCANPEPKAIIHFESVEVIIYNDATITIQGKQ